MIKNATFTSVWDGGNAAITTHCKVNTETKQVFDIEMSEVDESLESLEYEYVTIDGEEYPVFSSDEKDVNDKSAYWY